MRANTKGQTVVCIAVASTASLHFVAVVDGTADDIRHLLRGLGVSENSGCHWEIQVVDRTARAKERISLECDQARVVAHGREEAVVADNAGRITHDD